MAMIESTKWPKPIPSQRLGIDLEGLGYIAEPLHDAENAVLREKITKQGAKLEPELQTFSNIDLPTWYFWMKRAVEAGIAKVVKGKLPDKIDGQPRVNFVTNEPTQGPMDALTAAIEKQNDLMARLLEKLTK